MSYVPCTEKKLKLQKLIAVGRENGKQLTKTLMLNQFRTNEGIATGFSSVSSGLKDKNTKISNINRTI